MSFKKLSFIVVSLIANLCFSKTVQAQLSYYGCSADCIVINGNQNITDFGAETGTSATSAQEAFQDLLTTCQQKAENLCFPSNASISAAQDVSRYNFRLADASICSNYSAGASGYAKAPRKYFRTYCGPGTIVP